MTAENRIAPSRPAEDPDQVRVEAHGRVLVIRFDRPERNNVLTSSMYEAAADALVLGEADFNIRAFLVAGAAGAFISGSDMTEFGDDAQKAIVGASVLRFVKTLATVEKPVVAGVDGLASGIGTALLLHCDHVVASEWSVFSMAAAEQGIPPEAASSLLAPRILGYQRAFELIVMGRSFDALRALECGLVNQVVAPELVEETALAAASTIAEKPPEAVRFARKLLRGDGRDVVQRIDQEASGFTDLQHSREARDAFADFVARRGRR